jgi:hypothetical protein
MQSSINPTWFDTLLMFPIFFRQAAGISWQSLTDGTHLIII